MDLNLEYWQSNERTFLDRLRLWSKLLDPSCLTASDADIENARGLLKSDTKQHEKDKVDHAWTLSLSSVHADSGAPIPPVYRPQAFLPLAGPLVVGSLLPHKTVKSALFWHFMLHGYCAGFNHVNRNTTSTPDHKTSTKQSFLIAGAAAYGMIAGAIPQVIVNRLNVIDPMALTFCRTLLPIPISVLLAGYTLMVVRSEEIDKGIQVFDSNGNSVGLSKEAGYQAVFQTAVSRATLFGTTAILPNVLIHYLRRANFFQRNPVIIAPVKHFSMIMVFGLMIPVSFSLFPQLGKIERRKLESDLQALTEDKQLFYHRGL
ncbi:sideroflexin-4 [Astyanax mexicanus]|uniref:Sideroflexin-4 n=1 Tax=Astyanax mexicanus TaxID=7994 RepID=A0A8B9HHB3_ASTMX|nr:sideroflexin-4 [Astyanax mexicanus]